MKNKRRLKGEGSIRKLKSGKLSMTITIGRTMEGKQVRRSVSAWTRKELLDEAAKLRLKYNVLPETQKQAMLQKLTFEAFVAEVIAMQEIELSFNTLRNYKNVDKRYLLPVLGHLALVDITPEICDSLLANVIRDKSLEPTTLRGIRGRLNGLMNLAVKQDKILVNPLTKSHIKMPTKRAKAALFVLPSEEKITELLEYLKKEKEHFYAPTLLAVTTGMRRGEIIGLKWESVNFEKHTILITNQITTDNVDKDLKTTSSYRTIHVSEKVLDVLKNLPRESEYVFVSPYTHRHLTPNISSKMGAIFKHLDFPKKFTFHDLRHFHATQLLKHGVNIKVVSRRLGHANVYITLDLYFNYMPEMDEEASVVLDYVIK